MERSRWVAIDASTDPRAWARTLARARTEAIEGGSPGVVRDAIASSWNRSAHAGVDPEGAGPRLGLTAEEAAERWRNHPLSIAEPILRDLLEDVHSDDDQVVLICDADGTLLWIDGEAAVLDAAQGIHLQPGALWRESEAGTNAMGTALAERHPIQVFSAEHFSSGVHGWTCSAAPIRDPETGEALGVIDLSGELGTAHPHTLGLIEAAARVIEAKLETGLRERDASLRERFGSRIGAGRGRATALAGPSGRIVESHATRWAGARLDVPAEGGLVEAGDGTRLVADPLPGGAGFLLWRAADSRPAPDHSLRLKLLGRDRAEATIGGRAIELSPRHSEIAALLALGGEMRDAAQLARELYGADGKAVSARSELSRMRGVLGTKLAAGAPKLDGEVHSDFAEVERLAAMGRLNEAIELYPGPLLPASGSAAVIELRHRLDHGLREGAMRAAGPGSLASWLETRSGAEDLEACRELVSRLDDRDPRRPGALSRLRRLATA